MMLCFLQALCLCRLEYTGPDRRLEGPFACGKAHLTFT